MKKTLRNLKLLSLAFAMFLTPVLNIQKLSGMELHAQQNSNIPNCGLNNLGNTCFMNATLQVLSNIRGLSNYLINNRQLFQANPVIREYINILEALRNPQVNDASVSPNNFVNLTIPTLSRNRLINITDSELSTQKSPFIKALNDKRKTIEANVKSDFSKKMGINLADQKTKDSIADEVSKKEKETDEYKKLQTKAQEFKTQIFQKYQTSLTSLFYNPTKNILDQSSQQDAQEFASELLNALITGIGQQALATNNATLQIPTEITDTCFTCNTQSIRQHQEPLMPLSLRIENTNTLNESLFEFFLAPGQVLKHCDHCQGNTEHFHTAKILNAPDVLIIQLGRFIFNPETERTDKILNPITFPLNLDMTPYLRNQNERKTYKLVGFICHSGDTANSGHYVSYTKDRINGNWYLYNDGDRSEKTLEDIQQIETLGYVNTGITEDVIDPKTQKAAINPQTKQPIKVDLGTKRTPYLLIYEIAREEEGQQHNNGNIMQQIGGQKAQPQTNIDQKPQQSTQQEEKEKNKECGTCLDDKPASEFIKLSCGHDSCCLDCLRQNIDIALKDQKTDGLKCSVKDCNKALTYNEMKEILRNESEKFKKYEDITLKEALEKDPNTKHCPAPNCTWMFNDETPNFARKIKCPQCPRKNGHRFFFCSKCRLTHNPKVMTCEEAKLAENSGDNKKIQEQIDTLTAQATTRACPNCKNRIEKNNGCNHMTCKGCNYEFCWECGDRWDHDNFPNMNHPSYYECKNEEGKARIQTAQESARIERQKLEQQLKEQSNNQDTTAKTEQDRLNKERAEKAQQEQLKRQQQATEQARLKAEQDRKAKEKTEQARQIQAKKAEELKHQQQVEQTRQEQLRQEQAQRDAELKRQQAAHAKPGINLSAQDKTLFEKSLVQAQKLLNTGKAKTAQNNYNQAINILRKYTNVGDITDVSENNIKECKKRADLE